MESAADSAVGIDLWTVKLRMALTLAPVRCDTTGDRCERMAGQDHASPARLSKNLDNLVRQSSRRYAGWTDAHDVDGHTEFTSVPFREELVAKYINPRFRVSGGASRTFGERDPRGKTSGLGGKKLFFFYLKRRPVATRESENRYAVTGQRP